MPVVRSETYEHHIIKRKPDVARTSYYKYWGAIGDFYYFVTFMTPLWRCQQHHRIVLAADVYMPRYGSDPLLELCTANGLVHEVWTHARNRGGPTLVPPEYIDAAAGKIPNCDVYTPGIYYEKWLRGPNLVKVPVDDLRREARMEPKYVLPICTREELVEKHPFLKGPYVTVQPFTIGKKKRNVLPREVVWTLNAMGIPMVILRFPSDNHRAFVIFDMMEQLDNVTVIDAKGPVDSMQVLAHAACHVGVESSQILGAGIHDVTCVFHEYGGWSIMASDLALERLWKPVKFGIAAYEVAEMVYKEFLNGQ